MIKKYHNRFEIKYQISLRERDIILQYISHFMELDSHVKNNYDYEVRTLYFDSRLRNFFYEKIDGIKNRVKLRIRYYPGYQYNGKNQVFIELKRKKNQNVSKSRIIVPFEQVFNIINHNTYGAKAIYDILSNQEKSTLREVWYLNKKYHLQPLCVVCYKRQPYISKREKTFRLTFDTDVQIRNYNFDLSHGGGSKFIVPRKNCIMELKFNNFIPNWAIKIIQGNNCMQDKISKYANGLTRMNMFSLV